jgi:hypothetical protein
MTEITHGRQRPVLYVNTSVIPTAGVAAEQPLRALCCFHHSTDHIHIQLGRAPADQGHSFGFFLFLKSHYGTEVYIVYGKKDKGKTGRKTTIISVTIMDTQQDSIRVNKKLRAWTKRKNQEHKKITESQTSFSCKKNFL